jgi:hypothetical protein
VPRLRSSADSFTGQCRRMPPTTSCMLMPLLLSIPRGSGVFSRPGVTDVIAPSSCRRCRCFLGWRSGQLPVVLSPRTEGQSCPPARRVKELVRIADWTAVRRPSSTPTYCTVRVTVPVCGDARRACYSPVEAPGVVPGLLETTPPPPPHAIRSPSRNLELRDSAHAIHHPHIGPVVSQNSRY